MLDAAAPGDAAVVPDVGIPEAAARCDPAARFTSIAPLTGPDGGRFAAGGPTLTADESTLFVHAPKGDGGTSLYRAARTGPTAFGALEEILPLARAHRDLFPTLDDARGQIAFYSDRAAPGLNAPLHLHVSARAADGTFEAPRRVESLVPGTSNDSTPFLAADGRELLFASFRNASSGDLFRAARFDDGGFGEPQVIGGVNNGAGEESHPVLSFDGLTLYFASDRGYATAPSIFVARRASVTSAFALPTVVDELFNNFSRFPSWLSPDDCRLYFVTVTDGRLVVEVALREP